MPDVPSTYEVRVARFALALGIALVALVGFASTASAAFIPVTTTADQFDAAAPCSLREAIQTANYNVPIAGCATGTLALDLISVPAGNYSLTLSGQIVEDNDQDGDLDITAPNGNSGGPLTIDGSQGGPGQVSVACTTCGDRVLHIVDGVSETTNIIGMRFTGGNAPANGGGIFHDGVGRLFLNNVTVDGNSAAGDGGGVFSNQSFFGFRNVTLSGNNAAGSGGGLAYAGANNVNGAAHGIRNSTVVGNVAGAGGGGLANNSPGGVIERANTIVADNTDNGLIVNARSHDCFGSFTSGGYNITGTGDGCTTGFPTQPATDIRGTSASRIPANLAALADNGGNVLTRLPLRTSPVINRGYPGTGPETACEASDARGTARPQEGRCDVGAVEALAPASQTLGVDTTVDELNAPLFSGTCSMREAITATNLNQATGGCPAGSGGGRDTVNVPAGGYGLTRTGVDDTNSLGDLDLLPKDPAIGAVTVADNSLTIQGTGSTPTAIDGGLAGDRVMEVRPGVTSAILDGVSLRAGFTPAAGGGLLSAGQLIARNLTLSGNHSGTDGGGASFTSVASGNLENITVSGNDANGNGGGMATQVAGQPVLNNGTVTLNTASNAPGAGGGGLSGGFQPSNSIVAGNVDASGGDQPDCAGSVFSNGHNLIGTAGGCTFNSTTGDQVGSNASPLPGSLGPLASNGGRSLTHAPVFGSLALNMGHPGAGPGSSCALADQRGVARPLSGRCDIGAVEIDPPPPRLLTVSKGGSGAGTVTGTGISCGADCTESVPNGSVVALTATPASGSTFAGWTGCDSPSGSTCTQTLGADETVTATFNVVPIVTPDGTNQNQTNPVPAATCKKAKKKKKRSAVVAAKCKKKKKKKK